MTLDAVIEAAQVRERHHALAVVQGIARRQRDGGGERAEHPFLRIREIRRARVVHPQLIEDAQRLQPPAAGVRLASTELGPVVLAHARTQRLARQADVEDDLIRQPEAAKTLREGVDVGNRAVQPHLGTDGQQLLQRASGQRR